MSVPHIDHIGPWHTVGTQHNVNVAAHRGSFCLVATRGQWCFSLRAKLEVTSLSGSNLSQASFGGDPADEHAPLTTTPAQARGKELC